MKEFSTTIPLTGEIITDIDVTDNEIYLAITDHKNVVFPSGSISIKESFNFPIIRQLTRDTFLVAGIRVFNNSESCVIYDMQGNIITSFYAGDGIEDIEVLGDKIVITYFDEGVDGADGPNTEGLIVFDFLGNILLKYNSKHNDQIIMDCYCICKHGTDRIIFFPFNDFPFIDLNINTGEEKRYATPELVAGSSAITSLGDRIIFHSPYDDKGGLYEWQRGEKEAKKIGSYNVVLRGLPNGRFLATGERGFTILDFN